MVGAGRKWEEQGGRNEKAGMPMGEDTGTEGWRGGMRYDTCGKKGRERRGTSLARASAASA